jgi:hypothetical protein
MSDAEMRAAIAEACGWKRVRPNCKLGITGIKPGSQFDTTGQSKTPDYPNDLNAMHEAESLLKPEQWRLYSDKLMVAVRDSDVTLNGSNIEARYKAAHATARQRAEAFLRTIGKWKEGAP